jgi:hypothetical protein
MEATGSMLDIREMMMPRFSSWDFYTLNGFTFHYLFLVLGSFFAFLIYLSVAWFYLDAQEIWSPDTGAKLLQIKSLRLEDGKFAYDIPYWGKQIDPELQYALSNPSRDILRIIDGKLFLDRFPVFPLLTLIFYKILGMKGLYILPAIGGAAIVFFSLLLVQPSDRNVLMYFLIALGSPIFIYATIFWEHTIATGIAIICLGMAFLIPKSKGPLRIYLWLLIGILLSFSIYIRLEIALFALAFLFSFWLFGDFKWGPLVAGSIVFISLLLYQPSHELMFSGVKVPKNTEYIYRPFSYLRWSQWSAITDLLIGPYADEGVHTGRLGVVWSISAITAVFCSFFGSKRLFRTVMNISLGICIAIGFYFLFLENPYRSAHGLIFSTTWVVLAFTQVKKIWLNGNGKIRILVSTAGIGIISYSIAMIVFRGSSPHGGLEWGARFAFTFFPVLAIMAAWKNPGKRFSLSRLLVILFIVLGVGFQIRGLNTIKADKDFTSVLNQVILASPEQHILSDIWWLSLNAAPILDQKAIYVANSPEKLADWVGLAVQNDVWEFSLVTFSENLPTEISDNSESYGLYIESVKKIGALIIYRIIVGLG